MSCESAYFWLIPTVLTTSPEVTSLKNLCYNDRVRFFQRNISSSFPLFVIIHLVRSFHSSCDHPT